jgi:iron-sulfur cluster repair protein YtfE (RIC family)
MIATPSIQSAFAADHDRLDDLFANFRKWKRTDYAKAKEFFKAFKLGLQRHIVWEESVLFPRFEHKTGMVNHGPTEVMRMEHRTIADRLEEVHKFVQKQGLASDHAEQLLVEALSEHNQKEEHVLYPALDRLLSDEEKADVFTEMEQTPESAYMVCCGHPV